MAEKIKKTKKRKTLEEKYTDYKNQYEARSKITPPRYNYKKLTEAKFMEIYKNRQRMLKRLRDAAVTDADRKMYANRLKNVTRDIVQSQFVTKRNIDIWEEGMNKIYFDVMTGSLDISEDGLEAADKFINKMGEEGVTKTNVGALFELIDQFLDHDDRSAYWY